MFDDFDWGKIVQGAVQALPQVATAVMGNRAQQQGNQQAVAIANEAAARREAVIKNAAAPAISHFTATMGADPNKMTPQQQITLDDSNRELNNSNIPGRVGGRAFSRIFADTNARARAGAVQSNVARGDVAAGQVGQLATAQGNALTSNIGTAADVAGNAATAGGAAQADTYGAIGSFIASAMKDGSRESQYNKYKTGLNA